MSKLEKGYGSGGIQAILGDVKTYYNGELAKKANTSDLGTAAYKNSTNQVSSGSSALVESGAVKSYVDNNIPSVSGKADKVTNATSGHLAGLDSNGNLTDSGVSPTEDVTVEGNPVTFDSPFEQDAKSVVVSVKPIQDLHGYDHPWVGGGGKNFLGIQDGVAVSNGITLTPIKDNADNIIGITLNGTATDNVDFWRFLDIDLAAGTERYITLGVENEIPGLQLVISPTWAGINPSRVTTDAIQGVYINIWQGAVFDNVNIYPMICLNSETDKSFAPYFNICPISGIDDVEIEVSGKNRGILDASHIQSTYGQQNSTVSYANNGVIVTSTGNYGRCGFEVPVQKGKTYTISMKAKKSDSTGGGGILYGSSPMWDAEYGAVRDNGISTSFTTLTKTITAESDTLYIGIYPLVSGVSLTVEDFMVEIGEQASDFEPYNPNSHTTTIPLPSTLYDADVDVTNGSGNSTHVIVDLGDYNYNAASDNRFYTEISDIKHIGQSDSPIVVCSQYDSVTYLDVPDTDASIGSSAQYVIIRDTRFSDAASFKAAMSGVQLCYELATPITISFTPTDVELLEGTNVVSTNAEKVAVTYKAGILATLGDIDDLNDKVKTKFDKVNVATIETGSTASKTYYKGDYIVRSDGCLYDITAYIASGAVFTNNNTHKTNLGDELNKFKVYVSTDNSPVDGNDVASVSIPGYLPISPFQVFSWSGSGTVSITPKSSGGTWSASGDVSNVRYGQIFMRT